MHVEDLTQYVSETGLTWPHLPTWEEWAEIGPRLALVSNTSRWALADWLLLGGDRWPERADQVIGSLGLAYHSIENLRWVARRVPPSVRRPLPISFSHHALVASLPVDEQEKLLLLCEVNRWTRDEFRGWLVDTRTISGKESSPGKEWTAAQIETAGKVIERELRIWMRDGDTFLWFRKDDYEQTSEREVEATARLIARVLAKALV